MDINAGLGLGSGGLAVGFGLENGLTRSYITSAVCCARGCWFAVYLQQLSARFVRRWTVMGGGWDRALGLASIGVGFAATLVVAVAVSADYWLHTDEPIDTELAPLAAGDDPPPPAAADDADATAAEPLSIVTMVATHSGLWRVCIDAKVDYTGPYVIL